MTKGYDKGNTGLTIMLSVVVMLFVIGLIVMAFTLMGNGLRDATYTASSGTVNNETVTTLNNTVGDYLSKYNLRNVVCTVTVVRNATSGAVVPTNNYTMTNCLIKGATGSTYLNQNVNVSYTYTHDSDNIATNVMNDTVSGLGGVTSWFDIFVVITAMIVLILLVVIIIVALSRSGVTGMNSGGVRNVGTA